MLGSISRIHIGKSLCPESRRRNKRIRGSSLLAIAIMCTVFWVFSGCANKTESVLKSVFSQPQWEQYDFRDNASTPNSTTPILNVSLLPEVIAASESLGITDVQLPIYNDSTPSDGAYYHKSFQETLSDKREYTLRFNAYVSTQNPSKVYSAWITVLLPVLSEDGQQTLQEFIFAATTNKSAIEKEILTTG